MNIIIIGSRGYKFNYGGWETFVTEFVNNNKNKDIKFYIPKLVQDKDEDKKINISDNLEENNIYVSKKGFATMFIFTIKSFNYYLKCIKDNNLKNTIIISLGCKIGPLMPYYYKKINKMGVKIIMNPDGLEWKRDKWNFIIKKCFKISEKYSIKYSDYVVCDSKAIKEYIDDRYKKYNRKSKFIAYGAYLSNKYIVSDNTKKYLMNNFKIKINDYYLVVARFVPENNLELIIKEFMKSNTKKKLIIISNIEKNKYYDYLIDNTHFDKDERVLLPGPIYDKDLLREIRVGAFAYIHGHSAGGTNPSLLEALSTTNINILYDVPYNREVGNDAVLYFFEDNSLTKNINELEDINSNMKKKYGMMAKNRIKEAYTWDIVEDEYQKLFDELTKRV